MGAWESSEYYDEYAPPPPARTTVFVVRNGRYEPQNLMPVLPRASMLDFDGFVARRGAGHGCLTARPPDMRQATLGKNSVSVRRESLTLSAADAKPEVTAEGSQDANLVSLSFTFDALRPGTLHLHFMVTEIEDKTNPGAASVYFVPQEGAVAEASEKPAETAKPVDTFAFAAGAGQVYNSPPFNIGAFPEDKLAFDLASPRDIPVAFTMSTDSEPDGEDEQPKVLLTYLSIVPTTGRVPWTCQLVSQKLQHAGHTFVLHEVFGVNSKHAADIDVGNTECVICLTEPRDTAVLPCRHMCFCSYCAGIVRLQCDRCPVCRQKVQSLLQFKKDPTGEEAAAASSQ